MYVRWYFMIALIFISLITGNQEHLIDGKLSKSETHQENRNHTRYFK